MRRPTKRRNKTKEDNDYLKQHVHFYTHIHPDIQTHAYMPVHVSGHTFKTVTNQDITHTQILTLIYNTRTITKQIQLCVACNYWLVFFGQNTKKQKRC